MIRADLGRVLDIQNQAFIEDELYTFLYPQRKQYLEAFRRGIVARLGMSLCQPGIWPVVCVDDDDYVLGFAFWGRTVPDSMHELKRSDPWLQNNKSWATWLESKLLNIEDKYETLFETNFAKDYNNARRFRDERDPCIDPIKKVGPQWHCHVLGVAPEAQRKGVGQKLVEWAIDRAREETEQRGVAVPLTLVASVVGKGLYLKKGFRIVGWMKLGLEGSFQGGAALIWDPTDTWIKPAEPEIEVKPGRVIQVVWTERTLEANA